ncbi:unnamed protein product [Caretta caretta]
MGWQQNQALPNFHLGPSSKREPAWLRSPQREPASTRKQLPSLHTFLPLLLSDANTSRKSTWHDPSPGSEIPALGEGPHPRSHECSIRYKTEGRSGEATQPEGLGSRCVVRMLSWTAVPVNFLSAPFPAPEGQTRDVGAIH